MVALTVYLQPIEEQVYHNGLDDHSCYHVSRAFGLNVPVQNIGERMYIVTWDSYVAM